MTTEIKKKAHALKPAVRIGKSGLNDAVIEEIKKQLKKKKMIKIKFLKPAFEDSDRKTLVEKLLEETKAEKVRQVGNVVVLRKQ